MSANARWSRLEPQERRDQILGAALRLFGQRPYGAVSMSDVARAAGVTRGLVHHYFATKPELYQAVLQLLLDNGPEVVRTDLGPEIEQVVALNADASLDFIERNRETILVITAPAGGEGDPQLAQIVDRARETVVDRILVNHLGTSDVEPQVRLLIRGYLGLFEAVAREWLVHGRATRAEAHELMTRSLIVMMREVLPALSAVSRAA